MRRRLLTIAIFLLAGAVVNVAVAWGCAVWTIRRVPYGVAGLIVASEITMHPKLTDHHWLRESDWNPRPEDDDFVWKAVSREKVSGFGLERKGFYLLYPDVTSGQRGAFSAASMVVRDRSGWPLRALQAELWLLELDDYPDVAATGADGPKFFFESRFAVAKVRVFSSVNGDMIKDDRLLAYLPIWPGFAVNTLFYAGILWLLILAFALRRLIRQRRGLCLACGYDLRHAEHEACPECGVTA